MMAQFTVYTKPNCPWCDKAKALLDNLDIPYKLYVVGETILREDFIKLLPEERQKYPTVPQIYDANGGYIGTYEDLVEYLDERQ